MPARAAFIPGLTPASYVRHALHLPPCDWPEKNCYIDLWIELLHGLRLNPLAMLAPAVAVDFEDDQWTFFKPAHSEIWELYGLEVQELTVWRPLLNHALEHLTAGKTIITEADSFWLPDTSETDYRRNHVKSSIALNDLDIEARRLGYFHNAGYFVLEGEDFERLFQPPAADGLPLFAEFVRADRKVVRSEPELAALSESLLLRALQRLPTQNPIQRFSARVEHWLADIGRQGIERYHLWAFANTRQLGLAFELTGAHLAWLQPHSRRDYRVIGECCREISSLAKMLILKGARAASTGRIAGLLEPLEKTAQAWERLRQAA